MADEGMIEVEGGNRVWYGAWERRRTPVLLLHGGPGAAHDYMLPLANGSPSTGRRSSTTSSGAAAETPDDTSLWTVDRLVTEVDQVRPALGSTAATCSASRGADGSPSTTWPAALPGVAASSWPARRRASRSSSPAPAADRRAPGAAPHGADRAWRARRSTTTPNTRAGRQEFYRRHLCRLDPWPGARAELDADGGEPGLRDDERPDGVRRHRDPRTWDRVPIWAGSPCRRSPRAGATTRSRRTAPRRSSRESPTPGWSCSRRARTSPTSRSRRRTRGRGGVPGVGRGL